LCDFFARNREFVTEYSLSKKIAKCQKLDTRNFLKKTTSKGSNDQQFF
jgi:hypothetical protein